MTQRVLSLAVRYVVITPVRDEAEIIERTITSVAAQTILPTEWVVVDDGSTDRTPELVLAAANRYPWLTLVQRPDRGFRKSGTGVMEAFYEGYAALRCRDWEFLVKLDGDISMEPDYFENCFQEFHTDATLGVGGGTIFSRKNGSWYAEADPAFHVRGATKIYRRACWEAIGGLLRSIGWDTVDEVNANMLGWTTRTFRELPVYQNKPTGSADGPWKDWVKNGRANYIAGYHPLFMLLKCARRLRQRPYLVASTGLLYGFTSGYFGAARQISDRALVSYIRRQQMRRLFLLDTIWK